MKTLLTLYIIIALWKSPPNDKISYEQNNYVKNKTDIKNINSIIHISLNELNIHNVNVLVLPIRENWNNKFKGHIIKINQNNYVIYIDPKASQKIIIDVITHECVHLKQYHSNSLNIVKNKVVYDNKIYKLANQIIYDDRPWERNAFLYGSKLSKIVKNNYIVDMAMR